MMISSIFNELDVYPDLETFSLVNNFTNEIRTVTEHQLLEAFGEEEFIKIKSGRNSAWLVYKNI